MDISGCQPFKTLGLLAYLSLGRGPPLKIDTPKLVCLYVYISLKITNSLCSQTTRQMVADH